MNRDEGQEDHGILNSFQINENLSFEEVEDLVLLGKIWGYLKYYHPNVAKGDYDWDAELMKNLPEILHAQNKKQRDDALVKWIDSLGESLR
ncbi:hypothetical protein [Litchfieldia alkalitelluris]|uniref:hypothetical protein n=1 Tax=Litchfieldia alkalitelluris TaxID=304268 RepID=UPI000998AA1C|nr:hypothetical protein [Litchfieldia alkalitelluris]